jgi:hypothetical protein
MATSTESAPTKVWHCRQCGTRNVTRERDLFSDQCRYCTTYNDLDWSEGGEVSISEAAAEEIEAG